MKPKGYRIFIMSKHLLHQIESKLDELIERCAKLDKENTTLRANESGWQKERTRLIEKNEKARTRVEAMIAHLKNLEVES